MYSDSDYEVRFNILDRTQGAYAVLITYLQMYAEVEISQISYTDEYTLPPLILVSHTAIITKSMNR